MMSLDLRIAVPEVEDEVWELPLGVFELHWNAPSHLSLFINTHRITCLVCAWCLSEMGRICTGPSLLEFGAKIQLHYVEILFPCVICIMWKIVMRFRLSFVPCILLYTTEIN